MSKKQAKTTSKTKPASKAKTTAKKRTKKIVHVGRVHVHASYNNTIIDLTDDQGNVLAWSTSGASSFRGSRKATPFAAQVAAEKIVEKTKEYGVQTVAIYIHGPGPGREAPVRTLISNGLKITKIVDVTGTPHNGCRPPKRRRV